MTRLLKAGPQVALAGIAALSAGGSGALAASSQVASTSTIDLRDSRAAPLPVESMRTLQSAAAVQRGFLGSRGVQLRPYVGMQWIGLSGAKAHAPRARASWLSARAEVEAAVLRWPVGEVGASVAATQSVSALAADARGGQFQDLSAEGHALVRANSTLFGIPMIRAAVGYHLNRRSSGSAARLLDGFSGPRAGLEVSTHVDGIFTVGASGRYTWSRLGLVELGALVSHRLITLADRTWDVRFGVSGAVAKDRATTGTLLEETWTSFQIGLAGAL